LHSRLIDIARYGVCDRDAPAQDDGRKVSALVWLIPLTAFWVIVGLAVM
jgi:hypothetical protein